MEQALEKVNKTTGEITPASRFDPFQAMDSLDDAAILAEIEGRIIDKWVYHFYQDGEEVWGLSKVGVDMACREMAKHGEVIREEDVTYEVDPTDERFVLFKSFASRIAVSKEGKEVILDRTAGTKRQCIYLVKRDGISKIKNNFWFEQGAMKALRNARTRLISEESRSKIIALAKSAGKVKKVVDVEGKAVEESNNDLDKQVITQDQKATALCLCGAKLSDKAVQYYKDNPNREKICYDCNQLKKASKPYGKDRPREAGEEG